MAALLLASALSLNAYVLPGPAVAPVRFAAPAMQAVAEDAAKKAWLAKLDQPAYGAKTSAAKSAPSGTGLKAPKSGWTLTMAGGTRTVEDVWAAAEKAKKSYWPMDTKVSPFGGPGASSGW